MRKIILFLLIPSICYAASMSGIGDMRKSVYDSDKDGVVEYADNVSDADFGDVTVTAGDWAVEDDSHAHTGASLSGIDISEDTNLTAGDYITLNDDDLDVDNNSDFSSPDVTHSGTFSTTSLNVSGLSTGTWYARVRAREMGVYGVFSSTLTFSHTFEN